MAVLQKGIFQFVGAASVVRADGMIKYEHGGEVEWITREEWNRLATERLEFMQRIRALEAELARYKRM